MKNKKELKSKKILNYCIGNPHDGSVIKEFPNKESFIKYIEYVNSLPWEEEYIELKEYAQHGHGKCVSGSRYVENFF